MTPSSEIIFVSLFDDKRVLTGCIAVWTLASAVTFYFILVDDNSPFLQFGPNTQTKLMGVSLDTWTKWSCVAVYTFVSTAIAAFASDAIVPWITNTIQDHKTTYIPYSKITCLVILQVFTIYAVLMSVIGMFVALTQIDFMLIRMIADLIVNHITLYWFLRGKKTDYSKYCQQQNEQQLELQPLTTTGNRSIVESEARFVRKIARATQEALSVVTTAGIRSPTLSPKHKAGNSASGDDSPNHDAVISA